MSCATGRYSVYHVSDTDELDDLVYFLGAESLFELVPFASRQTSFRGWPYLHVYSECRPLWDIAQCTFTPHPRSWLFFFYHCRVESGTGETYRLFSTNAE
jgi:hypothetical protein